jgi:hypothetical protein
MKLNTRKIYGKRITTEENEKERTTLIRKKATMNMKSRREMATLYSVTEK